MMKKRLLALLGGSLLSMMFLAGCGVNNNDNNPAPPVNDNNDVNDNNGVLDNNDVNDNNGVLDDNNVNDKCSNG